MSVPSSPIPARDLTFADAHVLVTGGSSGIGRVFVRRMTGLGARVSVIALPDDDLASIRDELRQQSARFATEVTDRDVLHSAVNRLTGELVRATYCSPALASRIRATSSVSTTRSSGGRWRWTILARCMPCAVVPSMIERRRGSVVGISSTADLVGIFGYTPVSADRVAAAIIRGIERHEFLISADWQTRVIARTSRLLRGTFFAYSDRRVRKARSSTAPGRTSRR